MSYHNLSDEERYGTPPEMRTNVEVREQGSTEDAGTEGDRGRASYQYDDAYLTRSAKSAQRYAQRIDAAFAAKDAAELVRRTQQHTEAVNRRLSLSEQVCLVCLSVCLFCSFAVCRSLYRSITLCGRCGLSVWGLPVHLSVCSVSPLTVSAWVSQSGWCPARTSSVSLAGPLSLSLSLFRYPLTICP
jgi:hypothetical protein